MVNRLIQTGILLLLLCFSASAQNNRQLSGDLEQVLNVLPAPNAAVAHLVFEKIVMMNGGIDKLCSAVQSQPHDTTLQYALSGLAKFVTTDKNQRKDFNQSVCASLEKGASSHATANAFLLEQLKLSATDNELDKIKSFLNDDKLIDPAIAVFVSVGSKKAGKILLDQIKKSPDQHKTKLIKALADLNFTPAEKDLSSLVREENEKVSFAALQALPSLASAKTLEDALIYYQTKTDNTNKNYTALRLQAANRFLKINDLNSASLLLQALDKNALSHQFYIQYLSLQTKIKPSQGKELCLAAAEDENAQIAVAAINLLIENQNDGQAKTWIDNFAKINPVAQPHVIALLAHSPSSEATDFLQSIISGDNEANRLAVLQNVPSASVLIAYLKVTSNPAEITTIFQNFATKPTAEITGELLPNLNQFTDASVIAATQFLRTKHTSGCESALSPLLDHKNPRVRIAALQALRELGSSAQIPVILQKAQSTEIQQERIEALNTIAAIAERSAQTEVLVAESLAKLQDKTNADKVKFHLQFLSRIGAKSAVDPVAELANTENRVLSQAAHRALFDWANANALEALLPIAKETDNPTWHVLSMRAIKRLIDESGYIDNAKILYIERALAASRSIEDKRLFIGSAAQIQSEDALQLVLPYLKQDSLQVDAAVAAIQITVDERQWRDNEPVARVVRAVLKNAVEDENMGVVENSFEHESRPPQGFTTLFNGEDLTGWRGLAADPVQRQKMSDAEYSAAQVHADSNMQAHWKVEKGQIFFDGFGQSLCTAQDYENYELHLEWKIWKDGDSGIYLRGVPQVQIWDPAFNKGVGSGGLFNNKKNPDKPLQLADRPIGEWNSFRITLVDDHCTVYLNDVLVVDDVVLENYWERDKKLYPVGSIELQAHHSPLAFRNIYIRELPSTIDTNVVELFNGRDLSGWQVISNSSNSWKAEDGILSTGGHGGGWISTEKEYSDFSLELEFNVPDGGNSGVFIRAPHEGDPAYTGMEIQVLDDYAEKYATLQPWQYTGSIYAVQAPAKRVTKKAGEWQKMQITCTGPKVQVILNGEQIVDSNLIEHMEKTAKSPGIKRRGGYIGFQNHGAPVQYRNIRIREF
ncbi:DUF1080 domain-containing protein [candidate division KSB1 bacterium]|nr:DUF1080 domain-containing protein [candidate division KSB1 bacterium]